MEAQSNGSEKSQFALLRSRRFAPFFFTQLLGAFNDNLFKNALLLLVAFSVTFQQGMDANLIINLAAGLFILPFFLFSATAGQLADKYEKSAIIRWVKLAEIGVMGLGAWALIQGSVMALLAVLFFMGTQSAFFGPVKYAIIPQHLKEHELIGGNAQVEMGTFVAILLGTISAGVIMAGSDTSPILWVIGSILAVAVLGYFFSRWIPQAPASNPSLKIDWNPVRSTWKNLKMAGDNQAVFYSILGISWFWFLGSIYLTQLPNFTKEILHGSETVVTLLLTLFSVGIALGSLLCERLCGRKVELGLVPFGSIGLSLFGIDLYFSVEAASVAGLIDVPAFIQSGANLRLLFDLFMLGLFGGFYIVPLYAIVQSRTEEKNRARIISANNILNALFMVLAAIAAMLLLTLAELSIPDLFLVIALANVAIAVFIYKQVPEFSMRFLIWLLSHSMYRVRHKNLEAIPEKGAAVLVCNHVSYVDALILAGACRRPIRFVMYKPIYDLPVLNFIFRTARAIPITSRHQDQAAFDRAFDEIDQALIDNYLVCIFPEGKLTIDGQIGEFKKGIERIIRRRPVPVVPLALQGLWGSLFSHKGRPALAKMPRRFWSKIKVLADEPVSPELANADVLYRRVSELRGVKA